MGTSAIGAGLACPDWPACYGTVVPFLHPELVQNAPYTALQIFAEWAHRGMASVVGVGIVATGIIAYRRKESSLVIGSAVSAVMLLPVQVLLGGLTVTQNLQPIIVVGHLGVAMLIQLGLLTTTVGDWAISNPSR